MIKCFTLNKDADHDKSSQQKSSQSKIDAEIGKFFKCHKQGLLEVGAFKSDIEFTKKSENLRQAFDFFGIMADEDIESKKTQVLRIYKLIFRFSIEKLTNYLKNDMFLIILL